MKAGGDRLLAIDALRGLAALAVVAVHLPFSWNPAPARGDQEAISLGLMALPAGVLAVTEYGRFGVHLFLVISGFCIHLRWARLGDVGRDTDFFSFWRRRLRRLYPPYLGALLVTLAGLFVLFGVLGRAASFAGKFGYETETQLGVDTLSLVLLLQNLTGAHERVGNGPFWTLALEEQLYLLYFPLLALRRKLGWTAALLTALAVSLVWRAVGIGLGMPQEPQAFWYLLGPSRWIEWVLGALAVEGYFGLVQLPAWCSSGRIGVALLVAAIVANMPGTTGLVPPLGLVNDLLFGLAFFVLVNATCRRAPSGAWAGHRAVRILAGVGLFSYSLYLLHAPVVAAAKQVGLRMGLQSGDPIAPAAMLLLRLAAAVAVAYIFYLAVERPAIRASRKIRNVVSPASA